MQALIDRKGYLTRFDEPRLRALLAGAGVLSRVVAGGALAGTDRRNLCNRGPRGQGAQLELPRALRERLLADPEVRMRLASALRAALAGA